MPRAEAYTFVTCVQGNITAYFSIEMCPLLTRKGCEMTDDDTPTETTDKKTPIEGQIGPW